MASVLLILFMLFHYTLSVPIFFEIFGMNEECVFDEFEEREVMEFFYEIRAGQNPDAEIEIKIMTESNELLQSIRGYQDRVNYEIHSNGIYKICMSIIGHSRYDSTIVGLEMLGFKSETHYHQKNFAKKEHIDPMYVKLIEIGSRLDELEALQSGSKNWAIQYWDQLLFANESLGFYKWIQGWLLLIVSIFQIRLIRQWFAKVSPKLRTSKQHRISYRA